MKRKLTIIDRFMNGKSIKRLATHYRMKPKEIEDVLRLELESRAKAQVWKVECDPTDLSNMYLPKL